VKEDAMIRRGLLYREWDYRVIKWSLISAALALALGAFAEARLVAANEEAVTTTEVVEAVTTATTRGSG
jgi:hypothetical protein